MAKFYAMRIINGKTTFENVPQRLKSEVEKILVKEGYAELCRREK